MRVTTEELRQALLQKRKAVDEAEGSRQRARHPMSARPAVRSPSRPSPPPAQGEERAEPSRSVDLTIDSPGERGRVAEAEAVIEAVVEAVAGLAAGQTEGSASVAAVDETAPPAAKEGASAASEGAGKTLSTGGPATQEAEGAEGIRFPAISSRPSLLQHGKRAERLVKQVCLPEFQAELHGLSAGTFFREALVAQLVTTNSIVTMRSVLSRTDMTLRTTRQALEEAQSRAERAEKAAEASRVEAAEAAGRAAEAVGKLDAVRSASADDLKAARDQAMMEIERARIVSAELEMVNAAVRARDVQIEAFVNVVKAAEARAAEKETAATTAEAKAEEEARSAGVRAVEEYKSSEAFRQEVIEGLTSAFLQGFEDGRDTIGRLFGLSGLEAIGPGDAVESRGGGVMPEAGEIPIVDAPAEVPPAGADAAEEATDTRPDSAGAPP